MPRNTTGLRRGGPGRPKGALNIATKELKVFWGEFFDSEAYRRSATSRILAGKAPHLEGYLLARVYGRPAPATGDVHRGGAVGAAVLYRWMDNSEEEVP